VDPFGEALDHVEEAHGSHRFPDDVVGHVRPSKGHIVAEGARKEERLLGYDAQLPSEGCHRDRAQIVAVDQDAAL